MAKENEIAQIDAEINALKLRRDGLLARTGDDFPIEAGKEYYFLESLAKGIEAVKIPENAKYEIGGFYYNSNMNYKRYDSLFSTKQAAYDWMKKFLNNTLSGLKNQIKNTETSIEWLKALNPSETLPK